MAQQLLLDTYRDMVDRAIDYVGSAVDPTTERFARRAVQDAWNEFWSKRNWTYYYHRLRTWTVAPYNTGTVEYLHSSGLIPRQLTLTGGTWPSWAGSGTVGFGNIPNIVGARISGTVLQLQEQSNPGQDVAAGTTYSLWQDSYALPADFGAMGEQVRMGYSRWLKYLTPDEFVKYQRIQISPAAPYVFTIKGDEHAYGALAVCFYPPPDALYEIDASYRRKPRQLNILEYSTGTASTTSGLTTLTGTGTTFNAAMVGSVLRLAQDNTAVPTGVAGANPFYVERTITAFTDANTLTLDADPGATLSGVKYSISDPLDIEPGAMRNYFIRELERQMRMLRRMEPTKGEERQYEQVMMAAFEADSRHYESRSTFGSNVFPGSVYDMPRGGDLGG